MTDRMDAPVHALSPRHRVSGDLGHESAADLHARLVDLVQTSHDGLLELDLSGVEHIDEACLGVLRRVSDLLRARGRTLLLSGVPPCLTRAVYGAGLHHALHRGEIRRPGAAADTGTAPRRPSGSRRAEPPVRRLSTTDSSVRWTGQRGGPRC